MASTPRLDEIDDARKSPGDEGGDVSPAEPVTARELAEILTDFAALAASRPQEDFDDNAVFDAAIEAGNALGEKITVAVRRRTHGHGGGITVARSYP